MIKLEGLSKAFKKTKAVQDINLKIEEREIFGLVGPDGAGKTTLMRMICGLIEPDHGRVIYNESKELENSAKTDMGYMPQRFSLYGDLTVMENINFFGSLYGYKGREIKEKSQDILALTNLLRFKNRLADNLSGGMKQKLALTCALVTSPKLLVLDEPTYGVDPEFRKEFWKILYRLNKEGITILVSTPYMDEAELCMKVAFMDKGRITIVDSPQNLRKGFPYWVLEVKSGIITTEVLRKLTGVIDAYYYGDSYHLVMEKDGVVRQELEQSLREMDALHSLVEIAPSMEDVFVSLAEKEVV